MRFVGSLDQGTTSSRFVIINSEGDLVASAQKEHHQYLPNSGHVEHDANEIWINIQSIITKALSIAGIRAEQLDAIGITNQRETVVAWDVISGEPLTHAIVWQDARTHKKIESIASEIKSRVQLLTGLPLSPYFSASKMQWMLENVESVNKARERGTLKFGTVDSWIVYKLSGLHVTDVTNASRTLLMNIESLQWDSELLEIFGIKVSELAEIRSSSEVYGVTKRDGVFKCEVPIAAIVGDQHSAMIGQLCFQPGDGKCTYGTGNFALVNTGEEIVRSEKGLLTTLCYKLGNEPAVYALEGSVAVTGSAVQWLRDQLGIISSASDIESLARTVENSGGVYFVPAFSGLYAPYWRTDARGVIVGLTRATTKAHIARATLEAICYQTKEIMDVMSTELGKKMRVMKVDGGITNNDLCMQIQSDVMQIEISRPEIIETTALGAAFAAGLAVGVWKSREELRSFWKESKHWNPQSSSSLPTTGYSDWKRAIERSLNWV